MCTIVSDAFNNLSNKIVKKPEIICNEVDDLTLEESFPELRMTGDAHVRGKKHKGPVLMGSGHLEKTEENTAKSNNRQFSNAKRLEKNAKKVRRMYKDTS